MSIICKLKDRLKTTTRARLRVLVFISFFIAHSNLVTAQPVSKSAEIDPWDVAPAAERAKHHVSTNFPTYNVHAFCQGRTDFCEQKQQAMYNKLRVYWYSIGQAEKQDIMDCAGTNSDYGKLEECYEFIDPSYVQRREAERLNSPFHY